MATETSLTRDLCRALEACGASTYPLIGGQWSPKGWPDRLIGYNGWWVLVEFKVDDNWLRKDQQGVCNRLAGPVFVVQFVEKSLRVYNVKRKLLGVVRQNKPTELLTFFGQHRMPDN